MDTDDRPVGQILSRREALARLGSVSAAFLAACSGLPAATPAPTQTAPAVPSPTTALAEQAGAAPTPTTSATAAKPVVTLPTCVVRPAQTEGPYFKDEMLNRSDIRSDPADNSVKDGLPLLLTFHVSQISAGACAPLAGATVDIWHCDAQGVYSDVTDPSFKTAGKKFLRGYQVTAADGAAQFTTIYPGWYHGRAVHIHFKIRTHPASGSGYEFTSQLYFDDALTDKVHGQPPYASKGPRDTRNTQDGIFASGGDQLTLALTPSSSGYAAVFDIGLQV